MDSQSIKRATEDIQLIKQVLAETSSSLQSFSRIFIGWGILFSGVYILFQFLYPLAGYSHLVYVALISLSYIGAAAVYFFVAKSIPVIGLSRQLMRIWISIIVFQFAWSELNNMMSNRFIEYLNPDMDYKLVATSLLLYAFGLLCTGVLTGLRFPSLMAFIYVILGLFFILPHPLTSNTFLQTSPGYAGWVHWISWGSGLLEKTTFLILGIYLEFKRVGRI